MPDGITPDDYPDPAHGSRVSGYDGRVHFWTCLCGWTIEVPVGPHAGSEPHLAAVDKTYFGLQAHKRRMDGRRPLHAAR